jgi:hypothetical protein
VPRAKGRKPKSVARGSISGTNGKTTTGPLGQAILDERKAKPDLTDAEVYDILVHAMADVGADPALVYAFQKTGVYVCDENEKSLSKDKLKAFDAQLTNTSQRLSALLNSSLFLSFIPLVPTSSVRYARPKPA